MAGKSVKGAVAGAVVGGVTRLGQVFIGAKREFNKLKGHFENMD